MEKAWGFISVLLTSLLGFFMYSVKEHNEKLEKMDDDISNHKCDISVIKQSLSHLQQDTQEIKQQQKEMLQLMKRRR